MVTEEGESTGHILVEVDDVRNDRNGHNGYTDHVQIDHKEVLHNDPCICRKADHSEVHVRSESLDGTENHHHHAYQIDQML